MMITISTHSCDLSLELFNHGSDGSDLVPKTADRRTPINTVAPPRDGATERSNGGREAERSVLIVIGQWRRREFSRRRWRRRKSRGSRDRKRGGESCPRSSEDWRSRGRGRYIHDDFKLIKKHTSYVDRDLIREKERDCTDKRANKNSWLVSWFCFSFSFYDCKRTGRVEGNGDLGLRAGLLLEG